MASVAHSIVVQLDDNSNCSPFFLNQTKGTLWVTCEKKNMLDRCKKKSHLERVLDATSSCSTDCILTSKTSIRQNDESIGTSQSPINSTSICNANRTYRTSITQYSIEVFNRLQSPLTVFI
ncbi:hypothetical protein LXL04_003376 [Taraxacum kok-saghyz]